MLGEFNERRKEWDLALKEFAELQKQFTALAHETMVKHQNSSANQAHNPLAHTTYFRQYRTLRSPRAPRVL